MQSVKVNESFVTRWHGVLICTKYHRKVIKIKSSPVLLNAIQIVGIYPNVYHVQDILQLQVQVEKSLRILWHNDRDTQDSESRCWLIVRFKCDEFYDNRCTSCHWSLLEWTIIYLLGSKIWTIQLYIQMWSSLLSRRIREYCSYINQS